MVHLACINLPLLALQVVQRQEPVLRDCAAAVVESGRGQAFVLEVNSHAWKRGVQPGQRQAAALALAEDLQARTVPKEAVREAVTQVAQMLRKFSPHVESAADEPGQFWVSAKGMRRLFGQPQAWCEAMHQALATQGWRGTVVAGFGHFPTQVVARAVRDQAIFTSPAQERDVAARVPLTRCGLERLELQALTQLGLKRLGDLLRLPAEGLRQRFGDRLYRLHRLTTGTLQDPLQPEAERLAVRDILFLEHAVSDTERLLFRIKARLPFLLAPLAARQEALHRLSIELALDDHTRQRLEVQPAQPTRQERLILELVRLRLAQLTLPAGATEIVLEAEGRPREIEQPSLLGSTGRRDLIAANRALAQVRAELGEQAVVHAVPREGHLPEARFSWEPLQRIEAPQPPAPERPTLVRRLLAKPRPLPAWPRQGIKWAPGRSADMDNVREFHGPYTVSGGWWVHELQRDYYLAEITSGEMRWVFHDPRKGGWFCQGWVE